VKPVFKGLIIAALHVALVLSLGGKLLYDRATRPRVWAETRPYDPSLPIRGRYLSMQLITETQGFPQPKYRGDLFQWSDWMTDGQNRARVEVRNNKLVAVKDADGDYTIWFSPAPGVTLPPVPESDCDKLTVEKQYTCRSEAETAARRLLIDFPVVAVLQEPVVFFIPENAVDPTPWTARDNKQLWVEVTVPKKGPPRPIQLALKDNGAWKPLDLR
jgi:hypothetical protein